MKMNLIFGALLMSLTLTTNAFARLKSASDAKNFNSVRVIKNENGISYSACKLENESIKECVKLGLDDYYTNVEVVSLNKRLNKVDNVHFFSVIFNGVGVWILAPVTSGASFIVMGPAALYSYKSSGKYLATMDAVESSIKAPNGEFVYDGKNHENNSLYASIQEVIKKLDSSLVKISKQRKSK